MPFLLRPVTSVRASVVCVFYVLEQLSNPPAVGDVHHMEPCKTATKIGFYGLAAACRRCQAATLPPREAKL